MSELGLFQDLLREREALRDLLALSEAADEAYERWWGTMPEDVASCDATWRELEQARLAFRSALAKYWPLLEASKYLPRYPETMGLSNQQPKVGGTH